MIKFANSLPEPRTSAILGAGLGRHNIIVNNQTQYSDKQLRAYSHWGLIRSFLSDDLINTIIANNAAIAEQLASFSQNRKINDLSSAIGYLTGEGSKMFLHGIKTLADKMDKTKPIEGIVKMMRYCNEDRDSIIIDTSVQEIISILPMSNQTLKKWYYSQSVDNIAAYTSLNYADTQKELIGFILYYMLRANDPENVKNNYRMEECFDALDVSAKKRDYDDMYYMAAQNRGNQVYLEKKILEQFAAPNKLTGINPDYISKVLENTAYYMPNGYEKPAEILKFSSRGIDAVLNKNLNEGANIVGEAICFVLDCKKGNEKDDMLEECRSSLTKEHGIEGNVVDAEIVPASADIRKGYEEQS